MTIHEIMTANPWCIGLDDNLVQAAAEMKAHDVGILLICNQGRLVGVITDRDIAVRAVANGLDPNLTLVRTVMSRLIVYGYAEQDQEVAASLMETNRIRRLPVLDSEERLVGIVSLGDLALRTNQERMALRVLEHVSAEQEGFLAAN